MNCFGYDKEWFKIKYGLIWYISAFTQMYCGNAVAHILHMYHTLNKYDRKLHCTEVHLMILSQTNKGISAI